MFRNIKTLLCSKEKKFYLLYISMIRSGDKFFKISKTIGTCVRINKFAFNIRLSSLFTSHLQIPDKIFPTSYQIKQITLIQIQNNCLFKISEDQLKKTCSYQFGGLFLQHPCTPKDHLLL